MISFPLNYLTIAQLGDRTERFAWESGTIVMLPNTATIRDREYADAVVIPALSKDSRLKSLIREI
ncbi:hypothetical protein [Argonema galeatum]|uniref:hypothetical protein n=1 Tax=Argonema galeatum TaxID=2942762 RepID=UPI002012AEE4|nr:hypothetical protein [Argonema galeatum]MCL1466024.1 hypothetical protein [Argonema galeatum A003/A1]